MLKQGFKLIHDLLHLIQILGNLSHSICNLLYIDPISHPIDGILHLTHIFINGVFSVRCHIAVIIKIDPDRILQGFELFSQYVHVVGQMIAHTISHI